MGATCSLCGQEYTIRFRPLLLYGHPVCKKCYYGLANRRQLAFVVDWIALQFFSVIVGVCLGVAMFALGNDAETIEAAGSLLGWSVLPVFFCKDGFSGFSPGKLMTGVRVVDIRTRQPAGFGGSLKRNLPLAIPFMPLVVALELGKGKRIGDGWAHSMVIWRKYADSPVFAVARPSGENPQVAVETIQSTEPFVDDGNPYRPPLA